MSTWCFLQGFYALPAAVIYPVLLALGTAVLYNALSVYAFIPLAVTIAYLPLQIIFAKAFNILRYMALHTPLYISTLYSACMGKEMSIKHAWKYYVLVINISMLILTIIIQVKRIEAF